MKYKTEEGAIIDTAEAAQKWDEATRFDGNNHISVATGSQWNHETLYRSSKGRYYIESESRWQGSAPRAEFVSDEDAAKWLLENEHELPDDLKALEAEVSE